MPGPTPVRTAAGILGCALLLGSAACSSTTDGDGSPSTPEPTPAATDAGYSVQGALESLPALESDGEILVFTGDLNAATEAAGLERPTSLDDVDAYAAWINPISGGPGVVDSPVFVPIAEVFQQGNLITDKEPSFEDELGWSLLDADTFAERSTPPHRFAVVTGDYDESTFPEALPEVADGVVTAGEGGDNEQDLLNATQARPLGAPLRMAVKDRGIAAASSTDEVSAWLDGSAPTLADDPDLAAVAAALDEADVLSAALVGGANFDIDAQQAAGYTDAMKDELADALPDGPFDTVGVGWAADGDEPVATVAIKFEDGDAASAALPAYEAMFAEAPSLLTGKPIADLFVLNEATSDGAVAVLTLGVPDGALTTFAYNALMQHDLPFAYQ